MSASDSVAIISKTEDVIEEEKTVPIYTNVVPVYGEGEEGAKAQLRYENLHAKFIEIYGHEPHLCARAPGRVNLIGEHIDYEGYSVLPMAIRQDTIVAIRRLDFGKSDKTVHELKIANVQGDKYPPVQYAADPFQTVDVANHLWSHYFLCGYKGVFDHMRSIGIKGGLNCGLEVLVDGIVPTGAGLSSSAALVCASAIAVMAVFEMAFTKSEVAEFCCKCERYIGTQSGGMDQAISVMALPGVAKLISFDPIMAIDVKLPEGGTFVIANSLTESNKAETAAINYNNRVVECRLAAMVLAVKSGELSPTAAVHQINTLSDLQIVWTFAQAKPAAAEGRVDKAIAEVVAEHLHEEPFLAEEVEGILGTELAHIFKDSPTSLNVLKQAQEFKLRQRAQHVYAEGFRVHKFKEIATTDNGGKSEDVLERLGELMNGSHESCSKLYECSCPELEELVACARSNGALGSRLTGAGWGGCTVSLVRDDHVETFIKRLEEQYFAKRNVTAEGMGRVVFASKPAAGAAIFRMT
eukprot:TRINITY_DN20841_c0_g1_i1.p1 TRINITY_DN20841_c0_g1~~TRINITY_DN20841_c0_g1_i1.p1  ORF type:complete len:524 (-),score=97.90 TRINITY_DN20841_c0_g1_i1:958-2529(-)